MSAVATAVVGSSLITGYMGSKSAEKSGNKAADAQTESAMMQVDESRRQFDKIQSLLAPFIEAGTGTKGIEAGAFDSEAYLRQNPDVKAVLDTGIFNGKQVQDAWMTADDPAYAHWQQYGQKEGRAFPTTTTAIPGKTGSLDVQRDLLGLNGPEAQQRAIQAVSSSPEMAAMLQTGENAILQNASATGGLRGGNTQAALATFRPQLLSQLIQQKYANLGGLTSLSQNAAAGVGNAGMASTGMINQALGEAGAAKAGGYLAKGAAQQQMYSGINQAVGTIGGLKMAGYF